MKCASAISTATDTATAVDDVLERTATAMAGEPGDLAVALASQEHGLALKDLSARLRERGIARHVLGCTGESIVGPDREIEDLPALSLWVARFPAGTRVAPFALDYDPPNFEGWPEDGGPRSVEQRTAIVLGDPFTFPADDWLKALHNDRKGLRVVGGMASSGRGPGENRLLVDDQVRRGGAVGMLIDGPVRVRAVVSQGCRPIGRPMIVTKVEGSIVLELGRRPAVEVLRELIEELDETDRKRIRQGLHIGRVINEYQEKFGQGDFLVRNVLGLTQNDGIAITDLVRVGQTVQFHVRDAQTADEDLHGLLAAEKTLSAQFGAPAAGALLFTCNGRGRRLFRSPDHDIAAIRQQLGPIPTAGFFAMGEFGPIGGHNFIHGFTASVVVFSEGPAA